MNARGPLDEAVGRCNTFNDELQHVDDRLLAIMTVCTESLRGDYNPFSYCFASSQVLTYFNIDPVPNCCIQQSVHFMSMLEHISSGVNLCPLKSYEIP